jgi:hypothetical protein
MNQWTLGYSLMKKLRVENLVTLSLKTIELIAAGLLCLYISEEVSL